MIETMLLGLLAPIVSEMTKDNENINGLDAVRGLLDMVGRDEEMAGLLGRVVASMRGAEETTSQKVYVLTETDSEDPTWVHTDIFSTLEEAQEEMRRRYHDDVVERYELFESAHIEPMKANATSDEGEVLAWNIKECEVGT